MDAGANAAAQQAAMIAQAIKASGVIVSVEPREFKQIVARNPEPLVVASEGGFFSRSYQYLTGYRGLAFFCKSPTPIDLPNGCEVVRSKKIWIPG